MALLSKFSGAHNVSDLNVIDLVTISGVLVIVYFVSHAIYNIYFHPLSKFPGPKRAAVSYAWLMRVLTSGTSPQTHKEIHDKYGPVVRISPNQLSFCSASSWKDIYGHVGGRQQFLKSDTYENEYHPSIVSARDPAQHGQMRKLLSHGFSQKALMEQEDIVHEYVDLLIKQIQTHATDKPEGEEMVKWYNYITFDIIGDLAFGDPFGSLKSAEPHFWVESIFKSIEFLPWITVFKRIPITKYIKQYITPPGAAEARKAHFQYSRDKIIKRMNNNTPRKDFLTRILAAKEAQGISVDELQSHSNVLILAGSETTATFLSGFTYYLCKNPSVYAKLTTEIRGAFQNYEDIDGISTEKLKYLNAVIDETLRIYPPVAVGMPRISPGETVDGMFVPKGIEVSVSAWAATHSEANFHKPYEFIPERWIDPDCTDKKEGSQPFMLGSRVCLGRNLALLEMRAIVAKMMWTYDMELKNKDLDWDRDNQCFTLWRKPSLMVNFTRRSGIVVPPLDC